MQKVHDQSIIKTSIYFLKTFNKVRINIIGFPFAASSNLAWHDTVTEPLSI